MTKGEWEGGLKAKAGEGREGERKRTEGERKVQENRHMALKIEAELILSEKLADGRMRRRMNRWGSDQRNVTRILSFVLSHPLKAFRHVDCHQENTMVTMT